MTAASCQVFADRMRTEMNDNGKTRGFDSFNSSAPQPGMFNGSLGGRATMQTSSTVLLESAPLEFTIATPVVSPRPVQNAPDKADVVKSFGSKGMKPAPAKEEVVRPAPSTYDSAKTSTATFDSAVKVVNSGTVKTEDGNAAPATLKFESSAPSTSPSMEVEVLTRKRKIGQIQISRNEISSLRARLTANGAKWSISDSIAVLQAKVKKADSKHDS